jgi:hypothetical protein
MATEPIRCSSSGESSANSGTRAISSAASEAIVVQYRVLDE